MHVGVKEEEKHVVTVIYGRSVNRGEEVEVGCRGWDYRWGMRGKNSRCLVTYNKPA